MQVCQDVFSSSQGVDNFDYSTVDCCSFTYVRVLYHMTRPHALQYSTGTHTTCTVQSLRARLGTEYCNYRLNARDPKEISNPVHLPKLSDGLQVT